MAIIIVHFNTEKQLARCLEAIAGQTVPAQEVLVVDNASRRFNAAAWRRRFPWCRFAALETNLGFAAANNLGVEMAGEAEWIGLLNPDAYPEPDWLAKMLEGARSLPDATHLASHLVQAVDPSLLDGAGDVYHVSGAAWRRGWGRPDGCYLQCEEVFAASAAAAFYRRGAWLAAGGMDESFFCYYEDVDLCFRLALAGGRGYYLPSAVVQHEGGATVGGGNRISTYYGQRNMVITFFKDMPWPLLALYLPMHIMANLAAVVWCARRGHGGVAWQAKLDAIRLLPGTWSRRRQVQRGRRVPALKLWAGMTKGLWPLLAHWLGLSRRGTTSGSRQPA